jgi:hypothetical protein
MSKVNRVVSRFEQILRAVRSGAPSTIRAASSVVAPPAWSVAPALTNIRLDIVSTESGAGFLLANLRASSCALRSARDTAKQKFTHRGFVVVIRAGGSSKRVGIAATQRTRRKAHGGRRQVHVLIDHTDVFQDQCVRDRGILPRDPRDPCRHDQENLNRIFRYPRGVRGVPEEPYEFSEAQWKKTEKIEELPDAKERDRKYEELTKEDEKLLDEVLTVRPISAGGTEGDGGASLFDERAQPPRRIAQAKRALQAKVPRVADG